jgi:hypothetical protein
VPEIEKTPPQAGFFYQLQNSAISGSGTKKTWWITPVSDPGIFVSQIIPRSLGCDFGLSGSVWFNDYFDALVGLGHQPETQGCLFKAQPMCNHFADRHTTGANHLYGLKAV